MIHEFDRKDIELFGILNLLFQVGNCYFGLGLDLSKVVVCLLLLWSNCALQEEIVATELSIRDQSFIYIDYSIK